MVKLNDGRIFKRAAEVSNLAERQSYRSVSRPKQRIIALIRRLQERRRAASNLPKSFPCYQSHAAGATVRSFGCFPARWWLTENRDTPLPHSTQTGEIPETERCLAEKDDGEWGLIGRISPDAEVFGLHTLAYGDLRNPTSSP